MTGKQIAAARTLVGMSRAELAEAADISPLTVFSIENEKSKPYESTLTSIRAVLESRGIEFTNGDGIGVRLRYKSSGDTKPPAP